MPYMLDRLTVHQASAVIKPHGGGRWNSSLLHRPNQPLSEAEVSGFTRTFMFDEPVHSLKEVDFISFLDSQYLVSSRVLQHLQELEPDTHQILPFSLFEPPPIVKAANLTFGLINCCKFHDFIDIERSRLIRGEVVGSTYYVMNEYPLYAKAGWRPSGHLWRSAEPVMDMRDFVSDELRERLLGLGMEPWKFVEVHLS